MRIAILLAVALAGCGVGRDDFLGAYHASATLVVTVSGKTNTSTSTADLTIARGSSADEIFVTGDLCDNMPAVVAGNVATYRGGWGCSYGGAKMTLAHGTITMRGDSISGSESGTVAGTRSDGSVFSGEWGATWAGTRAR